MTRTIYVWRTGGWCYAEEASPGDGDATLIVPHNYSPAEITAATYTIKWPALRNDTETR